MPETSLRDIAAAWAADGWAVFPCRANKAPGTPNGFKDASREPAKDFPRPWRMIGGVPGSKGLVVVDVDVQGGASLTDLPAEWLETRRHKTRSGGWHLIFRARPGADYGNGPRADLGVGIDIRHDRGYIILPPSPGYTLDHDVEPLDAPEALEISGNSSIASAAETPSIANPIPRGQQDHELRAIANHAYQLGLDEMAVRDVVRHTIETRCIDQDPSNPFTERDVERLARPVPDTLTAAINRGEMDGTPAEYEPKPRERRLKLLTTAELAGLEQVAFLLDDMIVARGFNVLAGPSGGGKSFLAIDLAANIADQGGNVVYVMAEGSGGAYKRAAAWARHNGKPLPAIRWLVQAFDVMSDTPELLGLTGPCDLVIFDTLHRVTPGIDENSAQEMGRVIQAVDYVRETAGAATLLVHHSGWNDERERGSSALRGAADLMLHMRPSKADDTVLELRNTKMKEAEQWQPRYRKIVDVLLTDNALDTGGVIVEAKAPAEHASLEMEQDVMSCLLDTPGLSTRALQRAVTGDDKRIALAVKALASRLKVENRGDPDRARWYVIEGED
jgi:hypothetical protein